MRSNLLVALAWTIAFAAGMIVAEVTWPLKIRIPVVVLAVLAHSFFVEMSK